MSTEETKVVNESGTDTTEVKTPTETPEPSGDNKGTELPTEGGNKESGTNQSKGSDEVNEKILEFLKKQSDTIERQNKTIEELIKSNEETHKKMNSLHDRVTENIPEIIGSYDYEADLKALGKKGVEARKQKAKETVDMLSSMFRFV